MWRLWCLPSMGFLHHSVSHADGEDDEPDEAEEENNGDDDM